MSNKVVVFGRENSLYTKMVVYFLSERKIQYDLILEKSAVDARSSSWLKRFSMVLKSGPFKALKLYQLYTWYLIFEKFNARRNLKIKALHLKYSGVVIDPDFCVANINEQACAQYLSSRSYDYALFAGVGIVSGEIIKKVGGICLNSHPGPLPECRGGGALECALYKSLEPGSTVHVATEDIDAGDILKFEALEFSRQDNFQTISSLLGEHSARLLVDVVFDFMSNQHVSRVNNSGCLNYWADWSAQKQLKARYNLWKMKRYM